jgi:hypothetical protein
LGGQHGRPVATRVLAGADALGADTAACAHASAGTDSRSACAGTRSDDAYNAYNADNADNADYPHDAHVTDQPYNPDFTDDAHQPHDSYDSDHPHDPDHPHDADDADARSDQWARPRPGARRYGLRRRRPR